MNNDYLSCPPGPNKTFLSLWTLPKIDFLNARVHAGGGGLIGEEKAGVMCGAAHDVFFWNKNSGE